MADRVSDARRIIASGLEADLPATAEAFADEQISLDPLETTVVEAIASLLERANEC